MKFTEGAFKDWGTHSPSASSATGSSPSAKHGSLATRRKNAALSVEENAKMIDPGFDMMSPDQQNDIKKEVEEALKLWSTHGDGK